MFKITARDMITAQSFEASDAERVELRSAADLFRELTGTTAKTSISVDVVDFSGSLIGRLTYML